MSIHGRHSGLEKHTQASQNIADRLAWHTANRDQAGIAANLAGGEDIPEVYGLCEAGLFDEFFCFLETFGFAKLFEKLHHDTGMRKFRELVREENCNKLIIFDQDRYAIFDAYEVFILCGRNVRMPKGIREKITKDDILHKYGAILE